MAAVLYKTPFLKEFLGINALAGVEGISPARMRIPNAGSESSRRNECSLLHEE